MGTVARIVFHYDETCLTEETVEDLDTLDSKLKRGAMIKRNGKRWRIARVDVERPSAEAEQQDPLWRIWLRSAATNAPP